MDQFPKDQLTQMDIEIDQQARQHLNDTAKWTRFISIIVFVACGLLLLFGIFGSSSIMRLFEKAYPDSSVFSGMGTIFIFVVVFMAAVIGFIYYFLFQFSVKIKTALMSENPDLFASSLGSLKTFFIITAVLSVLSILGSVFSMF